MNELLEFTFEDVLANELGAMLLYCLQGEDNLCDAIQDGVCLSRKNVFDLLYWTQIGCACEDIACTLNLRRIEVGNILVESATIQVIHYSGITDVSVLLSSSDCKNANLFYAEDIYQWAKKLSAKYGASDFFGGLEPASDKSTQLFSRNGVGTIVKI